MKLTSNAEQWHLDRLIVCHAIAAIIGASMIWPATAEIWLNISTIVFYSLNGSLLWNESWAILWAALNTKTYDVLGAVLMFLPTIWYMYAGRHHDLKERIARTSVTWGAVIVVVFISKILLPSIDFHSPTLVLKPAVFLNELVPWIDAKWESKNSFPGDHAVAAFSFVGMVFLLLDRKTAFLTLIFGVLYSIPRLFSGAHWLSDELVGGGMALFIALGWMSNMPTLVWSRHIWNWIFLRLFKRG
jgi:Kdo2-lipid A phosphotransferase